MRLVYLASIFTICGFVVGCYSKNSGESINLRLTDDVQVIREASRQTIFSSTTPSIESISIVADCNGPTGPFETRITSVLDGRMLFEQVIDSTTWQSGISNQGAWQRTNEGFEHADSLTQTILQGHELHMLVIAPETRYKQERYAGILEFEGEETHAIRYRDVLEGEVIMYYSRESALPLGMKNINHSGRGAREIIVLFDNWEMIDSMQLFRKAIFKQGSDEYEYNYRAIELNAPLDSLLELSF